MDPENKDEVAPRKTSTSISVRCFTFVAPLLVEREAEEAWERIIAVTIAFWTRSETLDLVAYPMF